MLARPSVVLTMTNELSDVMNTLELRPRAEEKPDAKEPPSPSVEESEAERECNSARAAQATAQEAADAAEEATKKSANALEASGVDVARVEARLKEAEKEMARLKRKIERCVAENESNEDEGSDEEEQTRQAKTTAALELINKKELDEVRTLFKPPQVAPTRPPAPTTSRTPRAAA